MRKRAICCVAVMLGVMGLSFEGMISVQGKEVDHSITQAQAELEKQELVITTKAGVRHVFSVEVARTPREQEIGEMFRTVVPEDGGMLFVWPAPQRSMMWMKNTLVPLDMVFIGPDHRVQAIAENTVPYSLAPVGSQAPVIATLELKGGVTEKLGIRIGDLIETAVFGNSLRPGISQTGK